MRFISISEVACWTRTSSQVQQWWYPVYLKAEVSSSAALIASTYISTLRGFRMHGYVSQQQKETRESQRRTNSPPHPAGRTVWSRSWEPEASAHSETKVDTFMLYLSDQFESSPKFAADILSFGFDKWAWKKHWNQRSAIVFCETIHLDNTAARRGEAEATWTALFIRPRASSRKTGISQVTWPFFSFKWSPWAPPAPITDTMCDHVSWWWFDALKTRISDDVLLPASFKQNLWTWPAANQVMSSAPVTTVI